MKALKEHVVELAKHEKGYCTIITLLDAVDDTVLLNKIILGEVMKHASELALNEWGRKVSCDVFYLINFLVGNKENSICKVNGRFFNQQNIKTDVRHVKIIN